jgi:hypothetical protein
MTAHWTIDDNGDLVFTDAYGRLWTLTAAMLGDLVWTAETGQAATAVAALVADVRAARLAGDMAAVVREAVEVINQMDTRQSADLVKLRAAVETYAAAHNAHQQEET